MAATLWVFMAVLSAPLAVSMRESKPVVVKKNPFIIVQESSQSVLQPNANPAKVGHKLCSRRKDEYTCCANLSLRESVCVRNDGERERGEKERVCE
eukprot:1389252-Amorphochlora_amoeboformis.AAC.1